MSRFSQPAGRGAEPAGASGINILRGPGVANSVSSMQLNADGSIRNLGGYTEITSAATDERQIRFGPRISF